jgi:flagellar biosynthesis protein FlhF
LTGPPGGGKTTVAMQLAAHATGRGLEPKLIAFEPGRLTAAQALRSYAAVLGAPFELARRADHLANLLASRNQDTLTIVDGPGVGSVTDDGAAQVAAFASLQQVAVETWLVLPATLRSSDLKALVERFEVYRPKRLVFTRTAETTHWGAVWSGAEWAALPVAFFCSGPRIPEELKAAGGDILVRNLLDSQATPRLEPAKRGPRGPLAERASASGRS